MREPSLSIMRPTYLFSEHFRTGWKPFNYCNFPKQRFLGSLSGRRKRSFFFWKNSVDHIYVIYILYILDFRFSNNNFLSWTVSLIRTLRNTPNISCNIYVQPSAAFTAWTDNNFFWTEGDFMGFVSLVLATSGCMMLVLFQWMIGSMKKRSY